MKRIAGTGKLDIEGLEKLVTIMDAIASEGETLQEGEKLDNESMERVREKCFGGRPVVYRDRKELIKESNELKKYIGKYIVLAQGDINNPNTRKYRGLLSNVYFDDDDLRVHIENLTPPMRFATGPPIRTTFDPVIHFWQLYAPSDEIKCEGGEK